MKQPWVIVGLALEFKKGELSDGESSILEYKHGEDFLRRPEKNLRHLVSRNES
ncbi:hypothetical protein LYNGBM3L_35250 [Moorena producens 3L]|uniref:Uncharacterized protein n=1 Tax=Moorena producens 3L TaxID=489825 RepID=F4XUN3_9CYAN|nr:hypothetical protein LYNGBM3L_35250 [Moorena producens 3L]